MKDSDISYWVTIGLIVVVTLFTLTSAVIRIHTRALIDAADCNVKRMLETMVETMVE